MISRKQKTFRERERLFVKKHGSKYEYKLPKGLKSKDALLGAYEQIEIRCPTHGWFTQLVTVHQSGSGCKRCGHTNIQKTVREHFDDCRRVHGGKYSYPLPRGKKWNDPLKAHTKIKLICREHGPFIQALNSHKNGCRCPKCGHEETRKKLSKHWSQILEELHAVHGDKYDYPRPPSVRSNSDTVRAHQKIPVICPDHGRFESSITQLLHSKSSCPHCGWEISSKKQLHSWDRCLKAFKREHRTLYDYIRPKGRVCSTTRITIVCKIHGRFRQRVAVHKSGRGCQKCSYREGAYTEKYFKRNPAARNHPANLYLAYFKDKSGRERFWKIGMTTGDPSKRYYSLERSGGYRIKTVGVIHTTKYRAFREEQRILSKLADTGKLYQPRHHFGGHSEAFRVRSPYQVARWQFRRVW